MNVTSTTFGKRMLTIGILNEVFDSTIQNSFHFFLYFCKNKHFKINVEVNKRILKSS